MIFPYRIETLFQCRPWANWALVALMVLFHFSGWAVLDYDTVYAMVLQDWSLTGLLGHMFLHGGFMHLVGNMIVLWVFGNAVCGNTSNWAYPILFLGLGMAAGAVHLVVDGEPMVGASGAVNGITGMALAMYPLNRVSIAWWFWFRFGSFTMPLWGVALIWFLMDAVGALLRTGNVAHMAHIGGLVCGLALGWLALRLRWVELTEFDNRSLEEIFAGRTVEERRQRVREAEQVERLARGEGPVSQLAQPPVIPRMTVSYGARGAVGLAGASRAVALNDPLVMPVTAAAVADWSRRASHIEVSPEDAARIQAGGADGARRQFELLYGASFAELGYSFHRSLADYFQRVAWQRIAPHEGPALSGFLRMVEEDFLAMRDCGFVDAELAARRDERRLADFLRGEGAVAGA